MSYEEDIHGKERPMTPAKKLLNSIKWLLQKIFRKDHISDIEIINCREHLAKHILPRLKALSRQKFYCYPNDITSISLSRTVAEENNGHDKQQLENWKKTIDEMIFAFEYCLYADSCDKHQTEFYTKHYSQDPYKKFNNDFNAGTLDLKTDNVNNEIINQAHTRALQGFKLFGENFLFLYDYEENTAGQSGFI